MGHKVEHSRCLGVTLIELLIMVAIAAVLAAIVAPNLKETRERSNVSRLKADFRAYAVALEAYHNDYGVYPIGRAWSPDAMISLTPLSTPVAYMATSDLRDPFSSSVGINATLNGHYLWAYYKWSGEGKPASPPRTRGDANAAAELDLAYVSSSGPSLNYFDDLVVGIDKVGGQPRVRYGILYDPSNGSISMGAIARFFGETRDLPSPR